VFIFVCFVMTQSGNFWLHHRRIFFEKLFVTQLMNKFPACMVPKDSLPSSENAAIGPEF